MAQQCGGDGDGGGIAAKRAKLSSSDADVSPGEDRLSALPDDVFVLILLGLGNTAEAGRTSVLSRRWCRVWALLPELRFPLVPDGRRIREVLAAPDATPTLRRIFVTEEDSAPDSLRAWLPNAARRLSGNLFYQNMAPWEEYKGKGEAVQLPCFENATRIELTLGFLGLALPLDGTFTRLTELGLYGVRLHGPCELGDVISSRCPSLQKLHVHNACGMDKLTIRSESLLQVDLLCLNRLRQLSIVAPVLEELELTKCFAKEQLAVSISTPQLVSLKWGERYDPSSVHLGNFGRLQRLSITFFYVYRQHDHADNPDFQKLLQKFPFIHSLSIFLGYPQNTGNLSYLMEEITMLPRTASLTISIVNGGHAFGPSSFHVLRLCTGMTRLSLVLRTRRGLKYACQSGCNCDQPTNWKAEGLSLNSLEQVKLYNLKGAEHEVVFMKRLFSWATMLKRMRITFDSSVSESKARELLAMLSSFSRLETVVEFYVRHDAGKRQVFPA